MLVTMPVMEAVLPSVAVPRTRNVSVAMYTSVPVAVPPDAVMAEKVPVALPQHDDGLVVGALKTLVKAAFVSCRAELS